MIGYLVSDSMSKFFKSRGTIEGSRRGTCGSSIYDIVQDVGVVAVVFVGTN